MTFYGVIYGYRDPDTGKIRYIGQSEHLARRHKRHLKGDLAVDKWLQSLTNPPQPEIIGEVTGIDRQIFLDDIANRETVEMFHHHTHAVYCPDSDGFNQTIPQSKDFQVVGRTGGLIANRKHPDLARRNGKRQGRIQGPKNVASGQIKKLGIVQGPKNIKNGYVQGNKNVESGWARTIGQRQGKNNVTNGHLTKISTPENRAKAHRVANHIRWHVRRNIINPTCALC